MLEKNILTSALWGKKKMSSLIKKKKKKKKIIIINNRSNNMCLQNFESSLYSVKNAFASGGQSPLDPPLLDNKCI